MKVLLVSADLLARGRVETAATRRGAGFAAVAPADLELGLERERPDVAILDLDTGGEALLVRLQAARVTGLEPGRVIAYAGHVNEALLAAATAAGCESIARGRLWRQIDDMLEPPISPL